MPRDEESECLLGKYSYNRELMKSAHFETNSSISHNLNSDFSEHIPFDPFHWYDVECFCSFIFKYIATVLLIVSQCQWFGVFACVKHKHFITWMYTISVYICDMTIYCRCRCTYRYVCGLPFSHLDSKAVRYAWGWSSYVSSQSNTYWEKFPMVFAGFGAWPRVAKDLFSLSCYTHALRGPLILGSDSLQRWTVCSTDGDVYLGDSALSGSPPTMVIRFSFWRFSRWRISLDEVDSTAALDYLQFVVQAQSSFYWFWVCRLSTWLGERQI